MVMVLHNTQHVHSNNKNNNNNCIIMSPNSSSPSTMISAHNDNDIISNNSSTNDNTYLVEHLQFMQEQEENYYHPSAFAASCQHSSPETAAAAISSLYEDRRIMASWSYEIVDACSIDREMACIAMSYFDRFMCTPSANTAHVVPSSASSSSRMSRRKFQLAFLTCLVIALKCRAGMQVDSPFVSETICQGMYSPQEIVEMESIVLNALQWRLNGPSPQEFVVGLLQLLPSSAHHENQQQQLNNKDKVCIIEKLKTLACSHIESSMLDHTMAVQLPSRIAYAALLVAMSKLGHDVLSPSDRYAWVQNIALVSGLTTTSTRAPTSSISTTTSEKSYCADRSKDVRQRRRRQQQCQGGDRIPSSLSSSSSSSSSNPYSTRRHDNVVVVGHVVIDDHDSICDYEMGSSISCSSSRSSGSGGGVYATPDRRGIARSHHHHRHHAMMSMDPPETSMITEYYCTPVGAIGGESYWNQRYCTPISNTSLSTSTSTMTFGTTAMAASRR